MRHFALLDENNIVVFVCPIDEKYCLDVNGNISEDIGSSYCKSFYAEIYGPETTWKMTNYDGNYAGIGYIYNEDLNAFVPPKPYDSWTLNKEKYYWEPPVNCPNLTDEQKEKGNYYEWDEEIVNWKLKSFN
jgi:hypothetical protein